MARSHALCDEDAERCAPRVGCRCRSCYEARERALDPALIELISYRELRWHPGIEGPSRHLIHMAVRQYVAGQIEHAALYPEIVRALAKQCDAQFKQLMDVTAARGPIGIGLVEHVDGDATNNDPRNLRMTR